MYASHLHSCTRKDEMSRQRGGNRGMGQQQQLTGCALMLEGRLLSTNGLCCVECTAQIMNRLAALEKELKAERERRQAAETQMLALLTKPEGAE